MEGFKRFVPNGGKRNGFTVRVCASRVVFGAGLEPYLRAESFHLGHDGGKRFVLEPAEGRTGAVRLHTVDKGRGFATEQASVVKFLRAALRLKEGERITMEAKGVDGVLMFGVMGNEVRG